MIYENATIGKTKGIMLIELGNGDLQVASVHSPVDKYSGVQFVNDIPRPIGTKHNTVGLTSDEDPPDAMITFTSIESIEVVQEKLKEAKIKLRHILKT